MTEISDEELLEQFRSGNRDAAFKEIVKKYQRQLYRHIKHLVHDHDDTNDILQNTFIKAWRGLDTFREEAKLFTWLYRIATNESLSHLRKAKKSGNIPLDYAAYHLAEEPAAPDNMITMQRKLIEAISQLPEKQRLVFNLKYFEEMKYEEMAAILDTSVGALKASFHHAVKKIEDYVKPH